MSKRANDNQTERAVQAKAVAYARVSSQEQEKEGFSIPAQLKALATYAAEKRIRVVQEFVDVESAKQAAAPISRRCSATSNPTARCASSSSRRPTACTAT